MRRGRFHMERFEALLAVAEQHAGQVDDGVGALERARHGVVVADIAFEELDLSEMARRQKIIRQIGTAADRADAPARFGQRAHRMAADKSRGAEDGDEVAHACDPAGLHAGLHIASRAAQRRYAARSAT